MNRLLLIVVVCVLSGCRLHTNFKRTMITEPMSFGEYVSEKTERRRYRKIAVEVYETVWCNQQQAPRKNTKRSRSDAPHAEGFLDGFVDYMVAGGTVQPPLLPPRKYWNQQHQNVAGHHSAHDWFAGYEHGATTARDGGYREITTIPTLPQYYSYLKHDSNFAERSPFDPKKMHYRMMEAPVYFGAMSTTGELRDSFAVQDNSSTASEEGELLVLSIPVPSAPPFVRSATVRQAEERGNSGQSEEQNDVAWTPLLVSTPDVLGSNVYADDTADDLSWSHPVVEMATPLVEEQSTHRTQLTLMQPGLPKAPAAVASTVTPPPAGPRLQVTPPIKELTEISQESPKVIAEASETEAKPVAIPTLPVTTSSIRTARRNIDSRAPRTDAIDLKKSKTQSELIPPKSQPEPSPSDADEESPVVKFVITAPEPPATKAVSQASRTSIEITDEKAAAVRHASFTKVITRLPEVEITSFEESDE